MAKNKPSCPIRPLADRVLVTQHEAESKRGKILLPEQAKAAPDKGTVVAVPGDAPVKVGDVVWYKKYQAIDIEHEGKTYKALHYGDLLAVEE